jgi:hypothetical protein
MGRSVLAVVTGFVFIGALATGTDALVRAAAPGAFSATGRTDSVPMLLFTMLYVGVFATAGCYLTARLAPSQPMRHALVLGVLGLVFNVAGTVAMWDTAPAWYHVASLLLVMPYAWLGGRIRERQLHGGAVAAAPALAR